MRYQPQKRRFEHTTGRNMKKLTAIILAAVALCVLTACGQKVSVTFNGNGGETVDGLESVTMELEVSRYSCGGNGVNEFVSPLFVREGYKFGGWDTDVSEIHSDCTVGAVWFKAVLVHFDAGVSTAMAFDSIYLYAGDKIPVLPLPKSTQSGGLDDYEFLGWYLGDKKLVAGEVFETEEEEVTIVAKWQSNWSENY